MCKCDITYWKILHIGNMFTVKMNFDKKLMYTVYTCLINSCLTIVIVYKSCVLHLTAGLIYYLILDYNNYIFI